MVEGLETIKTEHSGLWVTESVIAEENVLHISNADYCIARTK